MTVKSNELSLLLEQKNFSVRDVVFLMSEIRKVIENDKHSFGTLKFYCDWTLHSQINGHKELLTRVVREIYELSLYHIQKPHLVKVDNKIFQFIYFKQLRVEMQSYFELNNLNLQIVIDEEAWMNFVRVLVKLLEEQPLVTPISEVASFEFIPSANGVVIAQLNFTEVKIINGKSGSYYRISNYY